MSIRKWRYQRTEPFGHGSEADKTLVFCFNVATTAAVQHATQKRIEDSQNETLMRAFCCRREELDRRLQNFQNRLYNYRQSLYLLFQDHPLAGPEGRVEPELALRPNDIDHIASRLAATGAPPDRSRFDRRRVLAIAEQVLVGRWRAEARGAEWIESLTRSWKISADPVGTILAPNWIDTRRRLIEGVSREHEAEPLPSDDDALLVIRCWRIRRGGCLARSPRWPSWAGGPRALSRVRGYCAPQSALVFPL